MDFFQRDKNLQRIFHLTKIIQIYLFFIECFKHNSLQLILLSQTINNSYLHEIQTNLYNSKNKIVIQNIFFFLKIQ